MDNWISVNDYMPDTLDKYNFERSEPVLVTYLSYHDKKTPYCDKLAVWDGKQWRWLDGDVDCPTSLMDKVRVEITHWMPLPTPANGE